MAIVTTDNKHYKSIAEAIRQTTSNQVPIMPVEMADGVRSAHDKGYSAGYEDGHNEGYEEAYQIGVNDGYIFGEQVARAECEAKHYVTVMPGSGETSLSFHVPFEPQFVMLVGYDPTAMLVNNTAMALICDLAAFGMMGGSINRWNGSSVAQTSLTTVSIYDRYSRNEDGFVTLTAKINSTSSAFFAENVQYTLIALKYTDKTDRERITKMVNGLTGSGSVTMNRAKVNAAFTDEEWSALIATKPDWTFAFVG